MLPINWTGSQYLVGYPRYYLLICTVVCNSYYFIVKTKSCYRRHNSVTVMLVMLYIARCLFYKVGTVPYPVPIYMNKAKVQQRRKGLLKHFLYTSNEIWNINRVLAYGTG